MRWLKIFSTILTLLYVPCQAQQDPIEYQSETIHLFRLTAKEARAIILKEKAPDSTYFHDLAYSYSSNLKISPEKHFGTFLRAKVVENEIQAELVQYHPFHFELINNSHDFIVHIFDSLGHPIPDLLVKFKNHKVDFDPKTGLYLRKKQHSNGNLSIKYEGETYYFKLDGRGKPLIVKAINNVIYRFPIGIVARPLRKAYMAVVKKRSYYNNWRYFPRNIYDRAQYKVRRVYEKFFDRDQHNVVLLNKPKYRPGDEVLYKLILLNDKGKYLNTEEIELRLSGRFKDESREKKLGTIKSYAKGRFEGNISLHDSLQMIAGNNYSLTFRRVTGKWAYANKQLRFEDYDLKSELYDISCPDEIFRGQSDSIRLTAEDENGLGLANVQVNLGAYFLSFDEMKPDYVFIPDKIWERDLITDEKGKLAIHFGDSLEIRSNYNMEIVASFKSSSNNIQTETCRLNFRDEKDQLILKSVGDSLLISSSDSTATQAYLSLIYFKGDTAKQQIRLPYLLKINPTLKALAVHKTGYKTATQNFEDSGFGFTYSRNSENLTVSITNKKKLPYWVYLYKGNRQIDQLKGNTDSTWTIKTSNPNKYQASVHYLWNGAIQSSNYALGLRHKEIKVSTNLPLVVSPGQDVSFKLIATDYKDRPVADADLSMMAYTSKFEENPNIPLPDFNKETKSRKQINSFTKAEQPDRQNLILSRFLYTQFPELDSLPRYHFLYPENGLEQYATPTKDSSTQFAVFVIQNGNYRAAEIIWLNNIPRYLRFGAEGQPYSFSAAPGEYDELRIRTADQEIIVQNINLKAGHKNLFCIDPDLKKTGISVFPRSTNATEKEIKTIDSNTLKINESYRDKLSYLNQGGRIWKISDWGFSADRIGPVNTSKATFEMYKKWQIDFEPEPYYSVEFDEKLIKLTSRNPIEKYQFVKNEPVLNINLLDFALNSESIRQDSVRHFELTRRYRRKRSIPENHNPENGRLSIQSLILPDSAYLMGMFLFSQDNPDFIQYTYKIEDEFLDLPPGQYSLFLLLNNEMWAEVKNISIAGGGTNYIKIDSPEIEPVNPKSRKLADIILWSEFVPTRNLQQRFKETYYDAIIEYRKTAPGFTRRIRGTVFSDDDHSPTPGVSVVIKGTSTGTATDINGEYEIYAEANSVLVFSFVGYNSYETIVNSRNRIDVTLESDYAALEEVVVVGYSTGSRKALTASVIQVSDQMLAGRVAGVNITANGTLNIKELESVNGQSAPLYILNGQIVNPSLEKLQLFKVNEVISGDAATALYGARAANGVIILQSVDPNISSQPSGQSDAFSIRNNFRDYAIWETHLHTNEKGEAIGSFKMPDDLTSWSGNIVAIKEKGVNGQKAFNLKSFQSLAAKLTLPRFMIEGDSAEAVGEIYNYSETPKTLTASFAIGDSLLSENQHDVSRYQKESTTIIAVNSDSLKTRYTINDNSGFFDGEERAIPIYPKGTKESLGAFYFLRNDTTITFDSQLSDQPVHLNVFGTSLDLFENNSQNILYYPYECNEQIASKLMAALNIRHIANAQQKKFKEDQAIKKFIKKLTDNQNDQGGWSWWGKGQTEYWITFHVLKALQKSEVAGFETPFKKEKLYDNLLLNFPRMEVGEKLETLNAFMEHSITTDYEYLLSFLPRDTLKTLDQHVKFDLINRRLNRPVNFDIYAPFEHRTLLGGLYFEDSTKYRLLPYLNDYTLLLNYRSLLKADSIHVQKVQDIDQFLFEKKSIHGWVNTYVDSRIAEELLPDYLDSAFGETKLTIKGPDQVSVLDSFPLYTQLPSGKYELTKTGNFPVFVSFYQDYWNTEPKKVSEPIEIKSSLGSKNELQAGEKVLLNVTLSLKEQADYLMVNVPIPAGCTYSEDDIHFNFGNYQEKLRNETNLYFRSLKPGNYTFTIGLIPRFTGKYTLNPAKAELMYFPYIFGREEMKKVTIE